MSDGLNREGFTKPPPVTVLSAGQAAYEAYRFIAGGKSLVSGATLPAYEQLPATIQLAWDGAARSAIDWWHADRDLEPPREITVSPSELAAVRMVVAEMANHWKRIGTTHEEDELIAQWRARAGLEDE